MWSKITPTKGRIPPLVFMYWIPKLPHPFIFYKDVQKSDSNQPFTQKIEHAFYFLPISPYNDRKPSLFHITFSLTISKRYFINITLRYIMSVTNRYLHVAKANTY